MSKILAKCIQKIRDPKGVIKAYVLVDKNGKKVKFTGDQIKTMMKNGVLEVINLQIDTLGRLVDKAAPVKPAPVKKPVPVIINEITYYEHGYGIDYEATVKSYKCDEVVRDKENIKIAKKVLAVYMDACKNSKSLGVDASIKNREVIAIEGEPVIELYSDKADNPMYGYDSLGYVLEGLGYRLWWYCWGEDMEDQAVICITKNTDIKAALAFRREAVKYIADTNIMIVTGDGELLDELDSDEKAYLKKLKDLDWVDLHLNREWFEHCSFFGYLRVCSYHNLREAQYMDKFFESDMDIIKTARIKAATEIIEFIQKYKADEIYFEISPYSNKWYTDIDIWVYKDGYKVKDCTTNIYKKPCICRNNITDLSDSFKKLGYIMTAKATDERKGVLTIKKI